MGMYINLKPFVLSIEIHENLQKKFAYMKNDIQIYEMNER